MGVISKNQQTGWEGGKVTRTILVVEERGVSKTTLESLIPQKGYKAASVPGYFEALYRISKQCFDIVFVSQSLSEMSGIEILTTAKSLGFVETHEKGLRPVFILFCEKSDEKVILQAWTAGFRHVVSRGITSERFCEIVDECLGPLEEPCIQDEVTEPEPTQDQETAPDRVVSPVHRGVISVLRIEDLGTTLVYYLGGNLSKGSGYMELRESVVSHLKQGKIKQIVLNCCEVSYVNSSGIAGLVSLRNEIANLGAEMSLVDAQEQVFNVLARLDLLRMLQYRPTVR